MKKLICILFSLTVLITSTFADKSRFYENGKVIDTMYVDSVDGLRVRDKPSLKSNRLCALQHRLPVKVVAIGREETIDGISAPWVEILIPRYEWKGDEAEFGWVFGGYLSKEVSEKFAVPKTKEQLEFYFKTHSLFTSSGRTRYDHTVYLDLKENALVFKMKPNDMWGGEITINSKNEFVYLDKYSATENVKFIITSIDDYGFETDAYDLCYTDCHLIWKCEESVDGLGVINANIFFDSPSLYFTNYFAAMNKIYFNDYWRWHGVPCRYKESGWKDLTEDNLVEELIKSGVSAKYTSYEQQYHDYWNPIMAAHQKKADEMKYN
ncbi:MAG: SH3 domain-containing protein [Treponema sp.]|nr:SH3 domain-containing protein [Candidatus Treponema merdequi]